MVLIIRRDRCGIFTESVRVPLAEDSIRNVMRQRPRASRFTAVTLTPSAETFRYRFEQPFTSLTFTTLVRRALYTNVVAGERVVGCVGGPLAVTHLGGLPV
ncbi:hypothetical protein C8N24_0269 [Solirubrobacter pauli]|uniref:Uncharacterized protein n=1 Tax=Solirubrobacter pauli TaxID=166793 RepID=A0A660L877_9ACTN|nr:hypothetical protein C8N24_0269 [Solirubrobacter pauli]